MRKPFQVSVLAILLAGIAFFCSCSHYEIASLDPVKTSPPVVFNTDHFNATDYNQPAITWETHVRVTFNKSVLDNANGWSEDWFKLSSIKTGVLTVNANAKTILSANEVDFFSQVDLLRAHLSTIIADPVDIQRVIIKVFDALPVKSTFSLYRYGFKMDRFMSSSLILPGMKIKIFHSSYNVQEPANFHYEVNVIDSIMPYDSSGYIKFAGYYQSGTLLKQAAVSASRTKYYLVNSALDFDIIHTSGECFNWKFYSLQYNFNFFKNFTDPPSKDFDTKAMIIRSNSFVNMDKRAEPLLLDSADYKNMPDTAKIEKESASDTPEQHLLAFAGHALVTLEIPVTFNKRSLYVPLKTQLWRLIIRSSYPDGYIEKHLKIYRKYGRHYQRLNFRGLTDPKDILNLTLLSNDKICLK